MLTYERVHVHTYVKTYVHMYERVSDGGVERRFVQGSVHVFFNLLQQGGSSTRGGGSER